MGNLLLTADDILRRRPWTTRARQPGRRPEAALRRPDRGRVALRRGDGELFSVFTLDRSLQIVFAAVKVPLLLTVTFLVGLPGFFVLNTLMGLRSDFWEAVRALVATQAGLAIILASLAPVTLFWYASSTDYSDAVAVNAIVFGIASVSPSSCCEPTTAPSCG